MAINVTTEMAISYSTENVTGSTLTEPVEQVHAGLRVPWLLLPRCQTYRFVIVIVLCSVGTLGFVGNALSAFIFWLYKKRSATVLLLIFLSVVDCLVVAFWVLVTCLPLISGYIGDTDYFMFTNAYIIAYVRPMAQTLHMMTTWLTVLVAIQRYLAVCWPHNAKKYGSWRAAAGQTLFVVVFALAFNLVRFLDDEIVETPSGRLVSTPTELFKGEIYQKVYMVGLHYTFMYAAPLLILAGITLSLSRALHKRSRIKQVMLVGTSSKGDHLTLSLLVIIVVFMTCQLMNPIRVIWEKLGNPGQRCDDSYQHFSLLVTVTVVFNSSFNCIIYTLFSRRFREHFLQVLRCRSLRRLLQKRVGPTGVQEEIMSMNSRRNVLEPRPQITSPAHLEAEQSRMVHTSAKPFIVA